ncbi:MAG: acetylglutamate kinase [Myxococcales bacterium]
MSRNIVIKVGGELLLGPEAGAVASDVAALVAEGHRVTLVHGGGVQATELQKKLGLTPNMISGRRVTDEPTLEVMKMIIAGKVNVELCGVLNAAGVRAVGLHGASAALLLSVRRPPKVLTGAGPEPIDLGLVGDVVSINLELIRHLHAGGYVPVIGCLGATKEGSALNINGDVVANRVAAELQADQLFLLTGAPGVLKDVNDPGSRIAKLSIAEGQAAIADGSIKGGMIPKLEESFDALKAGVKEIHIVGKLKPGHLLEASRQPGSVGTVLVH